MKKLAYENFELASDLISSHCQLLICDECITKNYIVLVLVLNIERFILIYLIFYSLSLKLFLIHPLAPKICSQSDPPPSEKRRLRPIYAYNVSTVRASKKVQLSRIGSWPRVFQPAIDEVRTLRLISPMGGSKCKFVIFVKKIHLNRINSVTKFLYVKLPVAKL